MNTSPEELSQNLPTAGEELKKLREDKDLSVEDVATQLHLDPQIIQALEDDNYDRFPADTYIRGYLRSYAKLLKVNGDEIIALYSNIAPEPPEIIPDVRHPSQVSSSDKPVKAFTYLVTFILVILLFIWWQQSNFALNQSLSDRQKEQINDDEQTGNQPEPVIDTNTEEVESTPAEEETTDMPANTDNTLTPEQSETIGSIQQEPFTGFQEVDNEIDIVPQEITAIPGDDPAPEQGEESPDEDNQALPGPDTIYLKLNADCWIEIHDRYGKEVYMDLGRTGEEIPLNGFAPFQVKLGNAQGVIVEFNGYPFDPAPYTTKGIARFSLGE